MELVFIFSILFAVVGSVSLTKAILMYLDHEKGIFPFALIAFACLCFAVRGFTLLPVFA